MELMRRNNSEIVKNLFNYTGFGTIIGASIGYLVGGKEGSKVGGLIGGIISGITGIIIELTRLNGD
ncbi:MAG: hypothetical protein ACTSRS_18890 [Candidatus Helarchaeota archaeon]